MGGTVCDAVEGAEDMEVTGRADPRLGVELADDPIRLAELAPARRRTVVLLGHEHFGIRDEVWELLYAAVERPVVGMAARRLLERRRRGVQMGWRQTARRASGTVGTPGSRSIPSVTPRFQRFLNDRKSDPFLLQAHRLSVCSLNQIPVQGVLFGGEMR